jgi:hypothetical protein
MRTTIGASLVALCLLFAPASGAGNRLEGPADEPALVAGTVFRDPGFALPRAEVVLTVKVPPAGVKPPKAQKLLSDGRGEFAFRVPPVKAEYLVTARAAGMVAEEKAAVLSGGPERVDLYFNLKAAK